MHPFSIQNLAANLKTIPEILRFEALKGKALFTRDNKIIEQRLDDFSAFIDEVRKTS